MIFALVFASHPMGDAGLDKCVGFLYDKTVCDGEG